MSKTVKTIKYADKTTAKIKTHSLRERTSGASAGYFYVLKSENKKTLYCSNYFWSVEDCKNAINWRNAQ